MGRIERLKEVLVHSPVPRQALGRFKLGPPTGGFPQFAPEAYKKIAEKVKDKIASKALALVVADTLPVQIDFLKAGLSSGQVGQRPFEMGYKSMFFMMDLKAGKTVTDPTYTGLDSCTPDNVATCIGG